jgi:hypothetical protein
LKPEESQRFTTIPAAFDDIIVTVEVMCSECKLGQGASKQGEEVFSGDRASFSYWRLALRRCLLPHLRTETDPVSETSCFLVSEILDDGKVQKPSNSECYTPSSEPYRTNEKKFWKLFKALTFLKMFS